MHAGVLSLSITLLCWGNRRNFPFIPVGIALVSVLSAIGICERCRIESGGVYFLIAHTLGSRFGGSLGLLYCFGQAVGCALNVLGKPKIWDLNGPPNNFPFADFKVLANQWPDWLDFKVTQRRFDASQPGLFYYSVLSISPAWNGS